ncbi:reverse transcriptase domain-containing protein [Tanacetum coccineum]
MPKALISDRGTHFCNKIMEKTMKRYGVNHRFSTSYHPQISGQVENTNRALKRILEKIVKDNLAVWSRKLDDTLWAFHTAYKRPNGTTPYKLIYGKNCHLPFEIEHRAYWALKNFRCEERHEEILELQNLVGSTVVAEYVQLPVVLERANIFQKNGIDPSKYTITLAHGLPLDVDDPVDVALAYREKMV